MSAPRNDLGKLLARGVIRLLGDMGFEGMAEVTLKNSRRVDVMAINKQGDIAVIEIKTTLADFRGDEKWPQYLDFCDYFYFAVPEDFPIDHLPDDHGLIIADRFGGVVDRPAPLSKMNGTRRKTVILNFARKAAARLKEFEDFDRIYRKRSVLSR
jgi:hypothetical protein